MAKNIMTSGIEMSDVIKTTGFPVPSDLEGKTFAECVSGGGGGADLEANHASSVNVEEYTQPIEITPAEGKNGMKKVTLTLTNIPSGEPLYIYHYEQGGDSLLCEASSFENITVGMKGVMSSAGSEYMTGVTCTEKTAERATFRNDTYSIIIASSDVPTALSSILD